MGTPFEGWRNPAKNYRPLVRWWWPGMDVDSSELLRELTEIDEQGFGGAEIQAFLFGVPGSIKAKASRIHRFAPNPFYYSTLSTLLEEAKRRGLIIDLTIGSSWPAGGTHVSQEDSLKTLF